jgi:formylglycine-generating enzyme required for sulfatase activity
MNVFFRTIGAVGLVAVAFLAPARANAPAGRYTITGGTVFDAKTKLTWQQTAPAESYTWADAKTYCQTVGASLGGTGWRLPTIKELVTIVDYSQTGSPRIDPTAFPGTPAGGFWSSSPVAGSPSAAWYVSFIIGNVDNFGVGDMANVRCVR